MWKRAVQWVCEFLKIFFRYDRADSCHRYNGRCVRLSQGDYSCRKVYDENPLEVAKAFQDNGLNRLHLVDLDGAKADHVVNYRTLEQIATHTTLSVDFGGGIKSDEDLCIAFECGADMVTGGSIAVRNRSLFLQWLDRMAKSI